MGMSCQQVSQILSVTVGEFYKWAVGFHCGLQYIIENMIIFIRQEIGMKFASMWLTRDLPAWIDTFGDYVFDFKRM
jgi:hypothetical protein